MRNYQQPGEVWNYTNDTGIDISADDIVIIGGCLGVAEVDIPDGATGSVLMEGVAVVPKVTGTAIAQGNAIDYDDSEGAVTTGLTVESGDVTGVASAFAAAEEADSTVQIKLGYTGGTLN